MTTRTLPEASLLKLSAALAGASDVKSARAVVVDHLDDIVPCRAHGIYELYADGSMVVDNSPNVPSWFLDAYEAEARVSDPIYAGVCRYLAPVDSGRLLHWRRWKSEVVYELLDRVGFQRSLQAPVLVNGAVRGTLNIARDNADPPYSRVDVARLNHVSALVSSVFGRLLETQQLLDQGDLSSAALNAIGEPIVVTSYMGEVLLLNRAARKRGPDGASIADTCAPVIRENLWQLRATGRQSITSVTAPVGFGCVTVRTSWLAGFEAGMAMSHLYLRDATPKDPPLDRMPLTPREREIVALVCRGLTVREIASAVILSSNTIKQHLKRIYAKMDVHSRAELVQAVWQSAEHTADPG